MKTTIDSIELEKFKTHAKAWWDKEGPLKTLHDINPVRLAFVKANFSLENMHVLDIGCGGGIFSEALALEGAFVTGLDAEQSAIDAARAHAEDTGLVVEYVCSPIEVYEHAVFDAITCMELLEHVDDFELIITHAARLLKPGGMLFLSTMNRTCKAYLSAIVAAEYVLSILPRQTHDFSRFIRPSELLRVLRRHRFELVSLRGMSYNPLTRQASLCDEVDVNYLLAVRFL